MVCACVCLSLFLCRPCVVGPLLLPLSLSLEPAPLPCPSPLHCAPLRCAACLLNNTNTNPGRPCPCCRSACLSDTTNLQQQAAEVEAKNKSKRSQVKGWIRDAVGFLKKEGEGSGNKKKLRSG